MGLLCHQRTRSSCSVVAHKYVTLDTEIRVCFVFFLLSETKLQKYLEIVKRSIVIR